MCGIVGFVDLSRQLKKDHMQTSIRSMSAALSHRGPDGEGIWINPSIGVALGHRRLSIQDLSTHGSQPMHSANMQYCLTYNGEIYNFLALRHELNKLGHQFKGNSDTEVMLSAFEAWGIEKALTRFVGMFAFALWDKKNRVLHLGRDRLGEKPLYYGFQSNTFLFASELKALHRHSKWHAEIDRSALALFMRFGYIPAPYSIFKNIYKLPAGSILSINIEDADAASNFSPHPGKDDTNNKLISPCSYWSAKHVAQQGLMNPFKGGTDDAVNELDALLRNTIQQQMISDVPLGAFLSGGIDSSTVVALMQAISPKPIKTFTIGFEEKEFDEAQHAKAVSTHLGTEHYELYITAKKAMEVIPKLPVLYDEPFADSSQIPTFLVSQLARQNVTVCVSGDGGDELFCGYNRYFWTRDIWRNIRWLPIWMRKWLASFIHSVPQGGWDHLFKVLYHLLPKSVQQRQPGYKLHKLAGILPKESITKIYYDLMSYWKNPTSLVLNSLESPKQIFNANGNNLVDCPDIIYQMLYWDLIHYLPNDNLVKVDRASMGVSLETRLPLLDHRVVEFAWRIPLSMKISNGQSKWLLRQVLNKYVPRKLIERPKTGFSVPIADWIRAPLRDWAEDLIASNKLEEHGLFNPQHVKNCWKEHLSGKKNFHSRLWTILMFQAWYEEYKHKPI